MIENDNCSVFYLKKWNAVMQTWRDELNQNNFKEAINETIKIIKERGAKYIISDVKDSYMASDVQIHWLLDEIDIQLLELKLEMIIFIVRGIGFTKLGIQKYQELSQITIEIVRSMKLAEELLWHQGVKPFGDE